MVEDTGEETRIARCGLVGRLALHDGLYDVTSLTSSSKTNLLANRAVLLDVVVAELEAVVPVQDLALEGQVTVPFVELPLNRIQLGAKPHLHIVDVVARLDTHGDRAAVQGLHEDLEPMLSAKHGDRHAADVQAPPHVGDVLLVVKEPHLIV